MANTNLTDFSDRELFEIAKSGNGDALALLLLRLHPQLAASLERKIGTRVSRVISAEDLLQETYQAAFQSFGQFAGENVDSLRAWLAKIAENRLLAAGRRTGTKKRGGHLDRLDISKDAFRAGALGLIGEISTGDATVSQFVARTEAVEAIRIAIAALPEDQQAVIRCRYFEQLSVEQTAAKLDRSSGSVRGLLGRARAALRTTMHNSALWLSRKD